MKEICTTKESDLTVEKEMDLLGTGNFCVQSSVHHEETMVDYVSH